MVLDCRLGGTHRWKGLACISCGRQRGAEEWSAENALRIDKLRRGQALTSEEVDESRAAHMQLWEVLRRWDPVNPTNYNTHLLPTDRVTFFVSAMRMALIDRDEHGGWPYRSAIRTLVLDKLQERISSSDSDPFLYFCALFATASPLKWRKALAFYAWLINTDPFLARVARYYVRVGAESQEEGFRTLHSALEEAHKEGTPPAARPDRLNLVEITGERFADICERAAIVVVDFSPSWPCRLFSPEYEGVIRRHPDVLFGVADGHAERQVAAEFGVEFTDALMIVRDRIAVFLHKGVVSGPALEDYLAQTRALEMDKVRAAVAALERKESS